MYVHIAFSLSFLHSPHVYLILIAIFGGHFIIELQLIGIFSSTDSECDPAANTTKCHSEHSPADSTDLKRKCYIIETAITALKFRDPVSRWRDFTNCSSKMKFCTDSHFSSYIFQFRLVFNTI